MGEVRGFWLVGGVVGRGVEGGWLWCVGTVVASRRVSIFGENLSMWTPMSGILDVATGGLVRGELFTHPFG